MFRITAICDKCKKEETQNSKYFDEGKNDWKEVTLQISHYQKKPYFFCVDCQKELGLYQEKEHSEPTVSSVADRLFDIIAEIVAEQIPEN